MLARLLDARTPGPRLRAVLLGGAPADRTLLTRARDAGWPVAPTYGLTEACSQVTVGEVGDVETSGRALPGVTVALAPDGEILVTGPTVAGGGTLRTGDLGRLDDRGRLIVTGRKADTIVSGGENVAPAEVEAVLREHPAVADAGVFARPHPEWGEAVTARVVLRRDATELELREWAGQRLAGFKVPKTIEVADALPRTASGKLLRGSWHEPARPAGRAIAAGWERYADAFRARTMPSRRGWSTRSRRSPATRSSTSPPGVGDTGFLAAELIEPGGTLITSDVAPEMLSAAQRRAAALGLAQRALPPDRSDLPIDHPVASVDSVLCRWGYMLMDDPEAACARPAACCGRAAASRSRRGPTPMRTLELAAGARCWSSAASPSRRSPARASSTWGARGRRSPSTWRAPASSSMRSTRSTSRCAYESVREWWETHAGDGARIAGRRRGSATRRSGSPSSPRAAAALDGRRRSLAIPARTWVAAATA